MTPSERGNTNVEKTILKRSTAHYGGKYSDLGDDTNVEMTRKRSTAHYGGKFSTLVTPLLPTDFNQQEGECGEWGQHTKRQHTKRP